MVVEDDPIVRRSLVAALQKLEVPVLAVSSCYQAGEEQEKEPADLVITDLHLPDGNGMDLLKQFRKANASVEVIIITGFGTIESAVEAMKMGASNYLLKPFTTSQVDLAIAQIEHHKELREENATLKTQLAEESEFSSLLSVSPEMGEVQKLISRVAPTNATILIEGESGTGKEVIARALHEKKPPARQALHQGQLRRRAGKPARERVLRPRARRLHRRHDEARGPLRAGQRRHASAR